MKLEQQVVSLELSKRLKELGVKHESLFCWTQSYTRKNGSYERNSKPFLQSCRQGKAGELDYSAFTVAELGEMLPSEINNNTLCTMKCGYGKDVQYQVCYIHDDSHKIEHLNWAETEADARAKMLIYLLENKLITL